ncbi:putative zinc-binding protein [Desulfomicrobium escambiense]|uniref:putative zinc-binding protein n=1 Tax=Desulfomicrobium escambiense TaxID=29503 RepID=UPI00041BE5F7|nr:putative zinc-binding protein [Desulfomicrobium escambiense]
MSEKHSCSCACGGAPKLIFACSGGADVGALADQAARKLTRDGVGRMFCLAGIGGRVSGIITSTEAAASVLVIDGCPLNCAKKTLEEAGFSDFVHLNLMEVGFQKGESPANEENIENVAKVAAARMTM